jgi:predicted RNase H-like nuclease (RuvC/YqgF family)
MGLHNQTGEMVTRDIMKTTLSLQRLQKLNSQLKQQLKQEQTSSRVKQMRVEYLEKKLVKMRDDATNEEPIQNMVSAKDNEIAILKKKLNLSDVDHVQTPELLAIQKEKEKLIEVIEKLNEQNISLQQQIQVLKQGIPSSSSSSTLADNSEDLVKALTDLNAKEIELEESRRTISTYETEINLLKDHIGEKEKQLKKVQGGKSKVARRI